jgi:Big-like domain-containing protein
MRRSTSHHVSGRVLALATAAGLLFGLVAAIPAHACLGMCGAVKFVDTAASPSETNYGMKVTFSGSIGDDSGSCVPGVAGCDHPTGRVDLYDGDATTPFASGDLTPETATEEFSDWHASTATLSPGDHTINIKYVPGNFNGSQTSISYRVLQNGGVIDFPAPIPSAAVYGQAVTLQATISPFKPVDTADGALLPTGSINFVEGYYSASPVTVATAPIGAGGVASVTTTTLTVGTHGLTAEYPGDTNYALALSPSTFDGTPSHYVTVSKDSATESIAQSSDPTVFGEPVTFSSAVTPTYGGVATGVVTFHDATIGGTIGTGTLASNQASLATAALAVGSHSVNATYAGDGNVNGSTSPSITHTVNKAGTTTTLAPPTPNPSNLFQTVTFTAAVGVIAPGAGTPTGSVQFSEGGAPIGGPVPLSGLSATLQTSTLGGGSHSIIATYLGDANFNTSASAPQTVTVRCDTQYTGTVGGTPGFNTTGTTCFTNASVAGSLTIPAGATVSFVGTTIGGTLLANSNAGKIVICGSTIGSLRLAGGNGAVTVGDPYTSGCAANTVKGTATLTGNKAGVTLAGNHITGATAVTNNSGGPTVVAGNTIGGTLGCSGDNPAASNSGHPNTVTGTKSGECAGSF